jgi:hypothetical protein
VADLLDFCLMRCSIPETFWLNEAAKKAKEVLLGTKKQEPSTDADTIGLTSESDYRIIMVLRLVSVMYDKRYCSFVEPRLDEQRRDDTYYFPKNCALLDQKKVTGLVAAAMMCANPQTNLGDKNMLKGRLYLANHNLMICDTPSGAAAGLQLAPSSSTSSASSASRPKRVVKPPDAITQPTEEEYDRAD